MTESTGAMPATGSPAEPTGAGRTPAKAAPAKTTAAQATPAATGERAKPRPDTEKAPDGPMGLTIRLPFATVTLGPQPPPPVAAGAGRRVERLAFYGGVAALGALGVLDWPVAAAVAAGTWVAQHTLPRAREAGREDAAPVVGTGSLVTGTPEVAAPDTVPPAPPAPGS